METRETGSALLGRPFCPELARLARRARGLDPGFLGSGIGTFSASPGALPSLGSGREETGYEMSLEDAYGQVLALLDRGETRRGHLELLGAPSDLRRTLGDAIDRLSLVTSTLGQFAGTRELQRDSGVNLTGADLYEFAMENALMGCMEEHVLLHTAVASVERREPKVSSLLVEVLLASTALSEAAWDVHQWCVAQLSPQRGRNIRAAQHHAVERLALAIVEPELRSRLDALQQRIDGKFVAA